MDMIQENNICALIISNLEAYHSMYSKNTKMQAALVRRPRFPVTALLRFLRLPIYSGNIRCSGAVGHNGDRSLQIFAGCFCAKQGLQKKPD
jgi:hypothetical protein